MFRSIADQPHTNQASVRNYFHEPCRHPRSGRSRKSELANRLAVNTGIPAVELDSLFWRPGLTTTSDDDWVAIQEGLALSPGGFLMVTSAPVTFWNLG